ncbi:DBF4-type zinc finger-containing protein 2 isoform X2 [Clupea harengus]|uniref:DBF4-type zinc finger-containing protein 2 isoform X2 n=1 Tax=Clupea harengus TaxID=7950 RepID=A0A6P3W6K0_CLUHA|nr:DBF4-type zinc finger-containing protein 2 isoform X2 [Clupea harengus]
MGLVLTHNHIISPRHREVVRAARSNVAMGSLMDRFLKDVMRHHPHQYNDTRPTHADLPHLTTLPAPREELSELCCGSKDDGASVGTREEMPSSDDESCPPTQKASLAPKKDAPMAVHTSTKAVDIPTTSTQGCLDTFKTHLNPLLSRKDSPTQGFLHRTSSTSLQTLSQSKSHSKHTTKVPTKLGSAQTQLPTEPVHSKDPTPEQPSNSHSQHRKANKKTNRREGNESASGSLVGAQPSRVPTSKAQALSKPGFESPVLWAPAMPAWKGAHRERTFSDVSDQINQVINEVIDIHCYGRIREQKKKDSDDDDDDEGSFHLSLHSMSNSAGSKGWDDTLQATLGATKVEEKNLAGLMETHISLEDQKYKSQLDSALKPVQDVEEVRETGDRTASEAEEVLPDLPHIPPTFVGKTWAQVMQEDDLKIDSLVKEFREGQFRCYFETESLARYGKHRRRRKTRRKTHDVQPQKKVDDAVVDCIDVLPLMEHSEEDVFQQQPVKEQTTQPQKRLYRIASRCQVVKVSHGTQTTAVSCPVVRRKTVEGASTSLNDAEPPQRLGQAADSGNETPKMKTRLCALRLPDSYSKVMSPLQPKTVVYVLSSPADTMPNISKQPGKRRAGGGRKKKTCDLDSAQKYKYKRTPLKYYDHLTNRILKSPPKGAPSAPKPKYYPHVRQLFRSLSPDNNKERYGFEFGNESWGSPRGWASSSVADLCASSTGSCLDSAGPSEPGSSLSSSRRALFSRSSMSSSNRFILSTLTPAPSIPDSATMAPSGSQTSSPEKASSTSDQTGGPRLGRRKRCGEKARSLTPAKNPSSPPYKRRKKAAKPRAKGKGGRSLQRTVHPRKCAGSRTSPRGKPATRASPRTRSRLRP